MSEFSEPISSMIETNLADCLQNRLAVHVDIPENQALTGDGSIMPGGLPNGGITTIAARNGNIISKNIAEVEREVFVGDLSFFCREYHLYQLFSKFGRVVGARIRRSESNHQSLMYGFVKMSNAEQAKAAAGALEDKMFMGRTMRVQLCNVNGHPSAYTPKFGYQLHVSFISNIEINSYVTEEFLRRIFEPFGEVVDALLTRHTICRDPPKQSGYGFVYMGTEQGAVAAIAAIQRVEIEGFKFDCSISHRSSVGGRKNNGSPHSPGASGMQPIQIPMPAIFMNSNQTPPVTPPSMVSTSVIPPVVPPIALPQNPVPPVVISPSNSHMSGISRRQFARLISEEDFYHSSSGSSPSQSPRQYFVPNFTPAPAPSAMQEAPLNFGPSPIPSPRITNSRMFPPNQHFMMGTPPQSPRYGSPMTQFVNPALWVDQQQYLARHVPPHHPNGAPMSMMSHPDLNLPSPSSHGGMMHPDMGPMYAAQHPMMAPYNMVTHTHAPNPYMRTKSHESMEMFVHPVHGQYES